MKNIDLVKKILDNFKLLKFRIGKKTQIKFVKDRPGHDFRYALNSKKIRNQLKWKPKVSFNEGIKKTIGWYLNNKSFFKSIPKRKYSARFGLKI